MLFLLNTLKYLACECMFLCTVLLKGTKERKHLEEGTCTVGAHVERALLCWGSASVS